MTSARTLVVPAKAGTNIPEAGMYDTMGPRFRGDDSSRNPALPQAAAADLAIAAFTRGMTSSAINCMERLLSAGSTQSMPA
jgi:hypothetical protein